MEKQEKKKRKWNKKELIKRILAIVFLLAFAIGALIIQVKGCQPKLVQNNDYQEAKKGASASFPHFSIENYSLDYYGLIGQSIQVYDLVLNIGAINFETNYLDDVMEYIFANADVDFSIIYYIVDIGDLCIKRNESFTPIEYYNGTAYIIFNRANGIKFFDKNNELLYTFVPDGSRTTYLSLYRNIMLTDYERGYNEGIVEGRKVGIDEGRKVGIDEGRELGYEDGYKIGLNVGYENGYHDGATTSNADINAVAVFIPSIIGQIGSFVLTIGNFSLFGVSLNLIFGILAAIGGIILLLKIFF